MSSEIKKTRRNYFELYADSVSRAALVGDLLKFTKFGEFKAGRDNTDVPVGTVLVAHMPTLTIGFIKWEGNRPVDHEDGASQRGLRAAQARDPRRPRRGRLGALRRRPKAPRDPWQPTNYLVMSDPETRGLYTFSTSSKTGLSSLGELIKAYGRRMRQFPDEYPAVELQCRHYIDPDYGEVRFPGFKVVEWVDGAPYAALLNGAADASPSEPLSVKKPPVATKPKAIEAPKTVVGTKAPPKPTTATNPRPPRSRHRAPRRR